MISLRETSLGCTDSTTQGVSQEKIVPGANKLAVLPAKREGRLAGMNTRVIRYNDLTC